MRRTVLAILFSVLVCGTAEAGVLSGIVAAWNVVPASIHLVNRGIHFVCGTLHSGLHGLAGVLQVDLTPSEPHPAVPE